MHQIPWDEEVLSIFLNDAILTDFEEYVTRARAHNVPRKVIARKYNMSIEAVDSAIKRIRRKYDRCAVKNPKLPKREHSGVWERPI